MNFKGKQRKAVTSIDASRCDKQNSKGVHHSVMSQTAKPKDAIKRASSSSCAKHLEFARLKETGKEWYFPLNVGKRRVQRPVTSLPRVKHCEKSTSRKFQDAKVYRSFMGEEETEDKGCKLASSVVPQQTIVVGKAITSNTERVAAKGEETTLTTRFKQQDVAIRRYALYRGMLKQSRFQEDHEIKKDTGKRDKASFNRRKEKDATASREISEDHDSKYMHRASSPRNASSGGNIPETIRNFISRKDDLIGSQFQKRIYIREISNGAIVDEVVDIKNERDWEMLNYMAPLRHISSQSDQTSQSLRFQDLINFDVYYYPYPWR